MRFTLTGLVTLLILFLLGCTESPQAVSDSTPIDASGDAPVVVQSTIPSDGTKSFPGAFQGQKTLDQGWNWAEQEKFWFLPQGSQLVPYEWFLALKQLGKDELFRDAANMDRYRYLPQNQSLETTTLNPDGLPIGFTKGLAKGDSYTEVSKNWLGLNCAACHTGQVEYTNDGATHKFLIDGAPAMADFEGMMGGLVDAMQDTLDTLEKFQAFFNTVQGKDDGTSDGSILREQLEKRTTELKAWNARNSGTSKYGFARLDAIGAIFNEIEVAALGDPDSDRSANAPVSYPFIWNTPQYDFVQWNASVFNRSSNGVGSMGRNMGEVLGVFGALELNTTKPSEMRNPGVRPIGAGHETSANPYFLSELEDLVWTLRSPKWPQRVLGKIDDTLAEKGKKLFEGKTENGDLVVKGEEKGCSGCHIPIDQESNKEFKAVLVPVGGFRMGAEGLEYEAVIGHGTDRTMAFNFINRSTRTGELEGLSRNYSPLDKSDGEFAAIGLSAKLLQFAVAGTLAEAKNDWPVAFTTLVNAGRPNPVAYLTQPMPDPPNCTKQANNPFDASKKPDPKFVAGACYKARSHNGIWATGPYLHNGSVRTIRQLLLPGKRETTFRVGSREYDPVNIGFVDAGDFVFDTQLQGNSNGGHTYGSEFFEKNEDALNAVLEYLKTL